ncbi:type II secretion system F family protein [Candidatus Raskinella chloraquaticus]|uniref:Type II secretion system protein n=1 Tax=Candidatus Raskinella chloraquaticus TaxID=1951219 RepID=A0A1W9HQF2_9HYPH|nr:MAG: type II secretion system protein [Proteobacteria bacterium SG_bin8]
MAERLVALIYDRGFMLALLAFIAAIATVLTLAMPFLQNDKLKSRMKSVATERDRLRQRSREKMNREKRELSLRNEPKAFLRQLVEQFELVKHVGTNDMKQQLLMAGFRGQAPLFTFLLFRLVLPPIAFLATLFYVFVVVEVNQPPLIRFGMAIAATWIGFQLPGLYLKNIIQKRQQTIKRAFPDALDLLLICVESGMAIEAAFRKVAVEIGSTSVPLAEELSLTTAELSYLPDRRQAYENLAQRTGLDGVKAVSLALIQAEKYGTSLGQTLRVMAQENRDMRMSEAEKMAAALPPKLTVPMIVFFLPVLFVVILGPAVIRVMNQ